MAAYCAKLVIALAMLSFMCITNAQTEKECLSDPCQTPANYCKNSGTCVLNSSECSAYCVCLEGFTGNRCEVLESTTTTIFTTTDVSKNCLVDPCPGQSNSSTCKNGGTCIRHLEKCDFTCACADGYTGKTCETKSSPNESGSICNTSGVFCFNGECLSLNDSINVDETTEICQCSPGWTGAQCNERLILRNYTTTITNLFKNDTVELKATTASQHSHYNVCSTDYVYRPATERTCNGILSEDKCVFGLCRAERLEGESWSGHSCECDSGAQGEFCDHLCCKDCGEHGACEVEMGPISATEHCLCDSEWTGDQCGTNKLELATSKTMTKPTTPIVNVTVTPPPIEDRFNACSVHYIERSQGEKTCDGEFFGHECTFGKCRRWKAKEIDWGGYTHECDCDHGAQGQYCKYKCCLECGDHGRCVIFEYPNSTLSEHCDCKPNYIGEHCETFVPEPVRIQLQENTWYLYVVGACAVVFVVLLVLAVVVPYMMWKHRVILIMKIVHYFKAYEDDDERQWDAFVSYKADEVDEHFVVHTLFPKLETELGFKLCLHFRDFVPGETIANNIIKAVEGSRRTILILTPRYVESEFTRFEYERAQQEMLRRKHRIIPLVLEDISDVTATMDTTLRNIIQSVTYLEWPHSTSDDHVMKKKEEKFWKRLHLSMPKKKEVVSSNSGSSSSDGKPGMTVSSPVASNGCSVNLSILDESGRLSRDPFIGSEQQHMLRQFSTESSVSSCCGRSYSCSGESCSTLYSELSDVDAPRYDVETEIYDVIPTLSEEQEDKLHSEA